MLFSGSYFNSKKKFKKKFQNNPILEVKYYSIFGVKSLELN